MNKKEEKLITSYEDPETYSSKRTIKRYKGALVAVSFIGVGLIGIFGFKAYQVSKLDPFEKPGSTLPQEYFLQSAKTYFDFDPSKLPTTAGSCTTVALKTVQEEQLMSDIAYYDKCDKNISLVKACKLESGNYHFEVNMSCGDNQSNIAYSEEKLLTDDSQITDKMGVKVYFSYQAQKLNTENTKFGEKQIMWKDEVPFENYKILKETTYYRYRDKNWKWEGDIRYYYPQNKSNTELVEEYYKESPNPDYPFKEVSQNYAYKWYIQNDDGPRHYYPSGSTNPESETTYYLTAPVKGAIRDEDSKTYASKYYKVETKEESEYLPGKPSNNAKKIENSEIWSNWSDYSLSLPKLAPFGKNNREIETRVKVEVIPIYTEESSPVEWNQITNNYVSESELINELQRLGYSVKSLEEVASLPDIKYDIKQTYREPKQS